MNPEKQSMCDQFERHLLNKDVEYKTLPNGQFNIYDNTGAVRLTVWVTTKKARDLGIEDNVSWDRAFEIIDAISDHNRKRKQESTAAIKAANFFSPVRRAFLNAVNAEKNNKCQLPFSDCVLVAVIQLPTGAKEVITNTNEIESKVQYYIDKYDDEFKLRANPEVRIIGIMLA
jgi:hypothetical protein